MILHIERNLKLTVFLIWIAIPFQAGCGCSPSGQQTQLSLEQILREEVKKAKAENKPSEKLTANPMLPQDGRQMIIEVAAKAFGADGLGTPHGKLVTHSESKEDNGHRKFVASWRRTVVFQLGIREGNNQEVIWVGEGHASGTAIDLTGIPAALADVAGRLKDVKNLEIAPNDPLQQALTLSGFPDSIRITALPESKYQAEVETNRVEIVVNDSTLLGAKLQK